MATNSSLKIKIDQQKKFYRNISDIIILHLLLDKFLKKLNLYGFKKKQSIGNNNFKINWEDNSEFEQDQNDEKQDDESIKEKSVQKNQNFSQRSIQQYDNNTRIIFYHKYFKRNQINLLKLIKRKKTFLRNKKDKGNQEYKDLEQLKTEFDKLQDKYSKYEEFINKIIVQNSKIVQDNKYLCLEIFKERKNAEIKTDKMIYFILTFLNKVKNVNQQQQILKQDYQQDLDSSQSNIKEEKPQNLELVQYNQQQQANLIKNIEQYLQSINNNQSQIQPEIGDQKLQEMLQKYASQPNKNSTLDKYKHNDIFYDILKNASNSQKEINVVKNRQKELQNTKRKNSEGFIKLESGSRSSRKNSLQLSRKPSLFGQLDDKQQDSILFDKLDFVNEDH